MSESNQTTAQSDVLKQFPLSIRIESGAYEGNCFNITTPKTLVRGEKNKVAQCAIIRGWNSTILQDLSGKTTVNGSSIQQVELKSGDRINCGDLQLRVRELANPHLADLR